MCELTPGAKALMAKAEKQVADAMARRELRCPECNYLFDPTDWGESLITYHGEEGPQEVWCLNCDTEFMVKEVVIREFVVTVKE